MYIKINQRYLNTNQTQKVKPTDIDVKRTYINMKQADAQINARWRFLGSNMRHRLLESGMVRAYSVSP